MTSTVWLEAGNESVASKRQQGWWASTSTGGKEGGGNQGDGESESETPARNVRHEVGGGEQAARRWEASTGYLRRAGVGKAAQ